MRGTTGEQELIKPLATLWKRAEEALAKQTRGTMSSSSRSSSSEVQELLYELQAYQRHLEQQEEELRQAREALEHSQAEQATRAREQEKEYAQGSQTFFSNESRLRTIIEKNADGIVLVDEQGIVQFVNPAAVLMFDRSTEELLGESFGFPVVAGETTEINIVRRDGKNLVAEMRVVETEWGGSQVSLATFRDITERKQAEATQMMRFAVTSILSQTETIHEAIPLLLEAVCEYMHWEIGEMWLVNTETHQLRWHSHWQDRTIPPDDFARASQGLGLNHTGGLYGHVWAHGQPAWIDNIANDPSLPRASLLQAQNIQTALVFPILNRRDVMGLIAFFSRIIYQPDDGILRLMTDLGCQIGQFIVRKRAEEELRNAHRALKTLNEVNQALIHATDETLFLQEICRIIVSVGGYHMAWAGLIQPSPNLPQRIHIVAGAGNETTPIETPAIAWTQRGNHGPTLTALRTGQPCIARNIMNDTAHTPLREQATACGYASSVTLPLMREDTPLGVLSIYAREPEAFGKEEINLLKEMTSDLTYGIATLRTRAERDRAEHNLRLHAERLKHMREIDQAILTAQTPHAIAKAVLRHLRRLVPYQWASIVGYELEAEHPVTQVVDTSDNNNLLFAPSGLYLPMIISGSLSERSDNGSAPYTYVKDISKQSKRSTAVEQLLAARIRSYISIPFIADGQVIGGISLGSVTPHAFDEQHVLIVREVADQLAVAINQARLFEQVRAGRERLQILYRRLMEGQETERHHIARELHDEIGQSLTAVKMSLQAIQHLPGAQEVTTYLKESITIVDQALQRVRNLSLDLRPSLLDDLGLVAALRWYVDRQAQWAGIAAEFIAEPEGLRLPTDLETVCFRVTQEALTNVVRHAHAHKMRVELHRRDTEVSLLISDDGTGFDVHAAQKRASRGSSLGLIGMQERVFLAGGEIDIVSSATRGTDVRVRFSLLGERAGERPPPPAIRMDRTNLQ